MNIGKKFLGMAIILSALLLACSPTEVSAQSPSNEQRLLGTWTSLHDSSTIVFNANGTVSGLPVTVENPANRRWESPTHWAASGNIIIVFIPGTDNPGSRTSLGFHISSDGRTLIIGHMNMAFGRN